MHNYELFFFDLDGTITESKSNVDDEMANIISQLLKHKKVVIISGARFSQFKEQFIDFLPNGTNLENLYIAPLTGGSLKIFQICTIGEKIDKLFFKLRK